MLMVSVGFVALSRLHSFDNDQPLLCWMQCGIVLFEAFKERNKLVFSGERRFDDQ